MKLNVYIYISHFTLHISHFTFHISHFTFQVCYIRGAATVSNQIHLSLSPVNMSGASSGFLILM